MTGQTSDIPAFSDGSTRPQAFHVMVKPRGSICNLDCAYCYYLKKQQLYPGASFRMTDELLEDFTRQYITAQPIAEVTFAWQGGEPALMGLDFYRKAVAFQRQYARAGMRITNTFQTNATLLDDEWCRFFKAEGFLVGVSIDGPRSLHDVYRHDKAAHPSFDRVMRGIALLQRYQVDFNTLTCVSAASAGQGLAVYRFLRDEIGVGGARFIQFIPIVERDNANGFQQGAHLTGRSISGPQYGQFLIDVFDEWVRRDVGRVFVPIFDSALANWLGQPPGLCVFAETCGQALALEFNGDLYACDHYVEPGSRLGNVTGGGLAGLAGAPAQLAFGLAKRDALPAYCRACEVRFACQGGCPKDRVLKTPEHQPGLNSLCAGYRSFFNYIDRPMRLMAAMLRSGQAPAGVVQLIQQPALRDLPDDAACPCGSGRLVGACHRAPGGYIPPGHTAPPPAKMGRAKHR